MSDEQLHKEQMKQQVVAAFNRVAPLYDHVGPQFFSHFGRQLVAIAQLPAGASVLDAAAGRGAVLFPAAERIGPHGRVIGIDLSETMVRETAEEINRRGLTNAEIRRMDAEYLEFSAASFDYVLCGMALFFFPDRERAMSEFRRVLKPGGRIAVTTWGQADERWRWYDERLKAYMPPWADPPEPDQPAPKLETPAGMRAIMKQAGFVDTQVVTDEAEFVYADEEQWWVSQYSHAGRLPLDMIEERAGAAAVQRFKAEAFETMQTIKQPDGFHLRFSILFTLASKPAE